MWDKGGLKRALRRPRLQIPSEMRTLPDGRNFTPFEGCQFYPFGFIQLFDNISSFHQITFITGQLSAWPLWSSSSSGSSWPSGSQASKKKGGSCCGDINFKRIRIPYIMWWDEWFWVLAWSNKNVSQKGGGEDWGRFRENLWIRNASSPSQDLLKYPSVPGGKNDSA